MFNDVTGITCKKSVKNMDYHKIKEKKNESTGISTFAHEVKYPKKG